MSFAKNSVDSILIKESTASLDTCVLSNLARYRDIILKGSKSKYYGKYNEDFMEQYAALYDLLKNGTGEVIVTLVGQIEISNSYEMFIPIMRVLNELNCKLMPFPSFALIEKMEGFLDSQEGYEEYLTPEQKEIILENIDKEVLKETLIESKFLMPMVEEYKKELLKVNVEDAYYYQNIASILSLIYRSRNDKGNRMMAVKDMFDAIMLAENKIYGSGYFFTNNVSDFKKCLNCSYGDAIDNVEGFFKDNLIPLLFKKYIEKYSEIDSKNMINFFNNGIKKEADDYDMFEMLNVINEMLINEKDEKYIKFLKVFSRTIYTQRYELNVSKIKRDDAFLDFINDLSYDDCEEKILELWDSTIDKTLDNNSDLVDRIYNVQGIHEKKDTPQQAETRKENIRKLFKVESKEELINSLIKALLKYKKDDKKRKIDTEIKILNVKR